MRGSDRRIIDDQSTGEIVFVDEFENFMKLFLSIVYFISDYTHSSHDYRGILALLPLGNQLKYFDISVYMVFGKFLSRNRLNRLKFIIGW